MAWNRAHTARRQLTGREEQMSESSRRSWHGALALCRYNNCIYFKVDGNSLILEDGMYKEIKIQKVGGSASATLPKAMLDRHQIGPGDRVFAIDTEQGILITPYDPDFA